MKHYLDYNATAPLCAGAKSSILAGMELIGNASSVHQFGRQVRQEIEAARSEISDFFSTQPAGIIFTSGATEANHLALGGFEGRIIVSAIEHDSVDQARPDRLVCPVDRQGLLDLSALEAILQDQHEPALISVMAANNETGILQPLDKVIELAKQYGAFVHSDAVQAVGRINYAWDGIDLISLSAHKIGGPQGIGALIMRTEMPLKAQLRGGGQERSLRSGTENFLGILGFAAALKEARNHNWDFIQNLRDTLEERLQSQCPDVTIFGTDVPRLPNTSVIAMKGVKSATQVMNFDMAGIAISAGSACSSGKVKPSRVLAAMKVPQELANCTIRVSLGPFHSTDVIDPFLNVWMDVYDRTRHQ